MLYKVTFKEDMVCGKTTTQIVEAKDKSEAKRKAIQRGIKGVYWDICTIEESEEEEWAQRVSDNR